MKILFQIPSLYTIYAGRTIYYGYKHAFEDLGHEFKALTADDSPKKILSEFRPEIVFTSLNDYNLKYFPKESIKAYKGQGAKIFVNIPFWKSPMSKLRINEAQSISDNYDYIKFIKSGDFGDVYYNICEQNDPRMDGFEKHTGYKYYTIPLAADKMVLEKSKFMRKFASDISFIGTNLPERRNYLDKNIFSMREQYKIRLYGQDWTFLEKMQGWAQRGGQYFNIPFLRSIQKPKLSLEDEGNIYASSIISINVHEEYQRRFGGDCNERTFKIPMAGGFEIVDNVECIKKYFKTGQEIILAKDKKDWFDKIDYYIKHPERRIPIIEAGRKRILREHTYHNRVNQLLDIYKSIK